ncbi:hypothetical protein [Vacuolonema iberomarrocanum]|uniref:hypothetical protein n=1 Tax=Vacuolonema iberomarrocanum TaxID=3454632 RepID=UPI003F6E2D07
MVSHCSILEYLERFSFGAALETGAPTRELVGQHWAEAMSHMFHMGAPQGDGWSVEPLGLSNPRMIASERGRIDPFFETIIPSISNAELFAG